MATGEETIDDEARFIFASTISYVGSNKELTREDLDREMVIAKLTADAVEEGSDEKLSVLELWHLILANKYHFARVNLDEGLLLLENETIYEISKEIYPALPEEMLLKIKTDYDSFQKLKKELGIAYRVQIGRLWEEHSGDFICHIIKTNDSLKEIP